MSKEVVRRWCRWVIGLPRQVKRSLLIANDLVIFTTALWLGYSLRLNTLYIPPWDEFLLVLAAAPVIGVATFYGLGLYKLVTRYIGPGGGIRIVAATALGTLLWVLVVQLSGVSGFLPRSTLILYFVLSAILVWLSRQFAGWFLGSLPDFQPAYFDGVPKAVLIYGAGRTGVTLLGSLRYTSDYNPVGFIDEDRTLWGQYVAGLKVHRPSRLKKLIDRYRIEEVLMAIPDVPRARQRTVMRRLQAFSARVKTLPAINDIASGRINVTDLRNITAEDLLGRDPISADPILLGRHIRDKSVMVTGAGGSIGSELARQILKQRPRNLVLFDISEAALFTIEQELVALNGARRDCVITPVIGSVLDGGLLRRTIEHNRVDTIYHAAAYKHVPLVERNFGVGIENNTFGTMVAADAAREGGVGLFVLVSTDKAVRPTNIMGASKRLAEQYLQAVARDPEEHNGTVFSIVRFGNVLDSSGSVVRLFRSQIENGGPITVTHPQIVRYFMSIPEAAELVIQAGALANGGDVFVLDMGRPVKIVDLARTMIRLMGLSVRDDRNPNGDINIVYTGLRDGEKLYEELLIADDTTQTAHPRIQRCHEPAVTLPHLRRELESLRAALLSLDRAAVHAVLKRTVEGYTPDPSSLPLSGSAVIMHEPVGRRTLH